MSGKSKVKQTVSEKVSEQSKKVETTPVTASAPSVEATTTQKGGKKTKAVTAQTTTPVATPVAAATPAVAATTAQKGGKKAKASTATTPAATTPAATPVVAATPAQKGGKKAKATTPTATAESSATPQKKSPKKLVAKTPKAPKVPKVAKGGNDEVAEEDDESNRHIRSFKVKLPGNEDFEGRFTGLTPYQAANKALSKYFREVDEPSSNVTFSICESTRKSKKSVYTYVGNRQKLDIPVTYTIQDGRVITKNFKNTLKKVKKAESTEQKSAVTSA
jgi:hypothetical protein